MGPTGDLRIDTGVEMTTRDGVTLVADVYRIDDDERRPALLHRTPYDRTNPALTSVLVADPVALARAGYAVVLQDVRGRFASGGTMDFARQEVDDGYDTVEWAAAQPWCDGTVGIYGSSYHAIAGYAALAARPPSLKAALVMIGTADLAATVHPGGLFELGFLSYYSLGQAVGDLLREGRAERVPEVLAGLGALPEAVRTLPVRDLPGLADPGVAPAWHDWTAGGPAASAWTDLPDVPLLSVVGFMDFMQPSMFTAYASREPSDRHRLVAGPWAHNGVYTGKVGVRDQTARAGGGVATWQPVIQGWFDRWLKGVERVAVPAARAMLDGDPVRWFVTGEDRWVSGTTWPPPAEERLFFLAGTALADAPTDGVRDYVHDPADPVLTSGGMFTAPMLGGDGVQDQRPRQARDDVLVWTGEVIDAPLTVSGTPYVELHLSSTAEDTDVVVTLSDVEPSGFVANVAEGALRVRSLGRWLTPGEPTVLRIDLHATAHTFRAGHRIRLDAAGSSFPRFSRHLGTRESPELGTEGVPSTQTVHTGTAYPSRLVLPVLGS